MNTCAKRLRIPAISLFLAACVLMPAHVTVNASNPHGAYYSSVTNRVFWFIHASDTHIGASGSTDADRLSWLVTTARGVITPAFVVVTGDLTDSTNGNIFGYPNGPYLAEWNEYNTILANTGVDATNYYDIPGNHDAYNDQDFSYYLQNSVQGRAGRGPQLSWTHMLGTLKYHFLGVNSSDNTGAAFSLAWPYGDYAGLDTAELKFISDELTRNADAELTLVFGHHPVTATGSSTDTYLYYGHQAFIQYLDQFTASTYNYGHTHAYSQALFTDAENTGPMLNGGIHYYNVASLGKSSSNNYSIVAIDCNGVSSVTKTAGSWPAVLITAPVDRTIGGAVNPYAYPVPGATANPIRALVFDAGPVSQVRYRVDGGATWYSMTRVPENPALWTGTWNASELGTGTHTIEVQAVGTTTSSDTITVWVNSTTNHAPVAAGDAYSVDAGKTLIIGAPGVLANDSDPDSSTLTAAVASLPGHGSVTLDANGGLTYTPTSGYSGPDSFTYRAFDGALYSSTAAVSITVKDAVTITSATYNAKRKQLSVTATSSAQPNATLTVVDYGTMTYKTKTKTYTFTTPVATRPASVTVTSSLGGSATKTL